MDLSSDATRGEVDAINTRTSTTLPSNYPPVIYPDASEAIALGEASTPLSTPSNDGINVFNGNDSSPQISKNGDLQDDLQFALSDKFEFSGAYAFSTSMLQAPNPCLEIAGIGLVGLPLNEREARMIVGASSQAPYGQGARTIVNTEVRDTWEIEPTNVRFMNPEWSSFIEKVASTACDALGVATSSSPPRCELYKLLLYETGSHFLPHQDTRKSSGMFATVIIVLPSFFTGGEVHVTHAAETRVLDVSPCSLLATSMLTWYTDVVHEVKPITSGYRLALSYNLIHTSQSPIPLLPSMDAAAANLCRVLEKWHLGLYAKAPDERFVAYLLAHEYSASDLNEGDKALKGVDAVKVAHLRRVAEELGYVVYLASLTYNARGSVERRNSDGKRQRYGYDQEDEEYDSEPDGVPEMADVDESSTQLENLCDLDGNAVTGINTFPVDHGCLIPRDPFDGEDPDDHEYEGYQGNWGPSVEYWYRRTVLVIFHEDDDIYFICSTGDISYALEKLRSFGSTERTAELKKIADFIVRSLKPSDHAAVPTMIELAIQWNDFEMWERVIKNSGTHRRFDKFARGEFFKAYTTFPFAALRPTLEEWLSASPRYGVRLDCINRLLELSSGANRDEDIKWYGAQMSLALISLKPRVPEDVPSLMAVVLAQGAGLISDVILPQLDKNTTAFPFQIALIKSLHEHKAALSTVSSNGASTFGEDAPPSDGNRLENMIEQCLNAVVTQWDAAASVPASIMPALSTGSASKLTADSLKIERITALVDVCITTGHMAPCQQLFRLILAMKGTVSERFNLYTPLIPALKQTLTAKGVDMRTSPFRDLFQLILAMYLRDVLKSKTQNPRAGLRKIGCGCTACAALDAFLQSSARDASLRYAAPTRGHLEERLRLHAPGLTTLRTERTGSPHALVVAVTDEVFAMGHWATRQARARLFVASVGADGVVADLMGERYADVRRALEGGAPFALAGADNARANGGALRAAGDSASGATTGTEAGARGVKRKKGGSATRAGVAVGPTIDLT